MSDKTITLSDIPVIKELVQEEIEKKTTPLEAEIEDVKKNGDKVEEITYSNLLAKVNTGTLTAGQQYRITDYVTTTAQADTQSAGHQFDIIVTADSATTLNHTARAVLHSGDTYFANSNLAAWELKYDIKNDTTKYAWASSSGRGVIYEMVDERNNRCGYDFKNIQFKLYKITAISNTIVSDCVGKYLGMKRPYGHSVYPSIATVDTSDWVLSYTFNHATATDYSLTSTRCHDNNIADLRISQKRYINIVVMDTINNNTAQISTNNIGANSANIMFLDNNHDNTLVGCNIDIICRSSNQNVIGVGCESHILWNSYRNNIVPGCKGNVLMGACGYLNFDKSHVTVPIQALVYDVYLKNDAAYLLLDIENFSEVDITCTIDVYWSEGDADNYIYHYREMRTVDANSYGYGREIGLNYVTNDDEKYKLDYMIKTVHGTVSYELGNETFQCNFTV